MQTVFNNDMTLHVWAQGSQMHGRSTGHNIFFEGRMLYSYGHHYLMGYLLPDGAFINADSNSVTTNQHRGMAASAVAGKVHWIPGLTDLKYALEDGVKLKYHRDQVKAWAVEFILDHPAEVRTVLEHFKMAVSFDACQRKAESIQRRSDRRKEAAKNRELKPLVSGLLHVKVADLEARIRKYDKDNQESLEKMLREHDGKARQALIFANKNGYGKRSREHLKALRRVLKAHIQKAWRNNQRRVRRINVSQIICLIRRIAKAREINVDNPGYNTVRNFFGGYAYFPEYWGNDFQNPVSTEEQRERRIVFGVNAAKLMLETYPKYVFGTLRDDLETHIQVYEDRAFEILQERQKRHDDAREAKEREYAMEQEEKRQRWLGGEVMYSRPHFSDGEDGAMVRATGVVRDENGAIINGVVETSWGAAVPVSDAIRVYRFVRNCRDYGRTWHRNGERMPVGHFEVDSIQANGNFKVGCHRFNWNTIHKLAVELKVA